MRWWPWSRRQDARNAPDALLSTLFSDSNDGVLFVDERRRIVSANDAALALLESQTPDRPFGVQCGEALACPLGTACPLGDDGAHETSKSCEAPVFGRTVAGPSGPQEVMVSCHRLPFGARAKMRGMVVIRRPAG